MQEESADNKNPYWKITIKTIDWRMKYPERRRQQTFSLTHLSLI